MRRSLAVLVATLALTALHAPASAIPRPDVIVGMGGSFATTGTPDGGGLSSSLSVMWPVGERAGFGDGVGEPNAGQFGLHRGEPGMTLVRNIQIRDPMPLNFAKGKWAGLRRDGHGGKNKCEYPDGQGMQGEDRATDRPELFNADLTGA